MDFSVVKLDNSSIVTEGLVMSSAPHSADIQRLVNISITSTEEDFVHDLEAQLFRNTSNERIIQMSEVSRVPDDFLNLTENQIKLSEDKIVRALMNVSHPEY